MATNKELVVQLRAEGKTLKEIGTQLGVSHQRVHQILYKEVFGAYPPSRLRYNKSEKRRKAQKRYRATEGGKKTAARYYKGEKGKSTLARYYKSEKGKAAHKRSKERR